ncbi:MAG: hypothetical protein RIC55_14115 [Pirellulaceae bacterium]
MSADRAIDAIDSTWTVIIVEVTQLDVGLSFFLGRLHEAAIPFITMSEGGGDPPWPLSEDGMRHVSYSSADDVGATVLSLENDFASAIPKSRIREELIYQFWFPRGTASIRVVCPKIHEADELKYATLSSPDYTYLDNLGDTDALLELTLFLSRCYPKSNIDLFSSDDLPDGHTSDNLVVIGGPGSAEISNEICRQMMSLVNSSVAYSEDCEAMRIILQDTTVERRAQYRMRKSPRETRVKSTQENGFFGRFKRLLKKSGKTEPESDADSELERDWGYFARFPNPLNDSATIVLVNGIHTRGVLGAARAFGDRRESLPNFQAVYQSGVEVRRFECFFEVPVVSGAFCVPKIDAANVLPVGTNSAAQQKLLPRPPGDRRESVRVLFIAGDRGGSQIHQIQMPNEFHAIQEALRSSRHCDVIGMTNPILGATRERLARAYLERGTILHFSGHGNDRCLAILKDEHLTANAIPLSIDQVCEMIKTMEQRVRLCVLNACLSKGLAQQVVDNNIVDFAIGWSGNVDDSPAIAFASALYGAIGDGRTLEDAFLAGKVACGLTDQPELLTSSGQCTDTVLVDTGDTT